MKRLFALVLALALGALMLTGCSGGSPASTPAAAPSQGSTPAPQGEPIELVYICRSMNDAFGSWLANTTTALAAADYNMKVISVLDMENDAGKAVEAMETATNLHPDVIIMQPSAEAQLLTYIQAAEAAGIKVVLVNLPLPEDPEAVPTVVCDDYTLGYTLAEKAAANLPENANVVYLDGIAGLSVSVDRRQGFQEGLLDTRADVTLLAEQYCSFNQDEAMNIMEDWLQMYSDIDGVICASDGAALGAIEAYKSAGKDFSQVQFYGIDGLADACLSIQSGEETGSVLQDANAMAKEALELAAGLLDGSVTGPKTVSIAPTYIDASNVEEMIAMHKKNGLIS